MTYTVPSWLHCADLYGNIDDIEVSTITTIGNFVKTTGTVTRFTVCTRDYIVHDLDFEKLAPMYYPIIVLFNGLFIKHCPIQTKLLCDIAVSEDAMSLQYVIPKFKTAALCEKAVNRRGAAIRLVPTELRTTSLYMLAIKTDPLVLENIPQLTYDLCKQAIHVNPFVVGYIPHGRVSENEYDDLLVLAASLDGHAALSIRHFRNIPQRAYVAAVKQNAMLIQRHIPIVNVTLEICEIAGRENCTAYTYYCPNPVECLCAVLGSRGENDLVGYHVLSQRIGLMACRLNVSAFQFVVDDARFGVLRSLVADRLVALCPVGLAASLLVEVSLSTGTLLLGSISHSIAADTEPRDTTLMDYGYDASLMDYGRWWSMCVAVKRLV